MSWVTITIPNDTNRGIKKKAREISEKISNEVGWLYIYGTGSHGTGWIAFYWHEGIEKKTVEAILADIPKENIKMSRHPMEPRMEWLDATPRYIKLLKWLFY